MTTRVEDVLDGKIRIPPVNPELIRHMRDNWDRIAKPIGSFGQFEQLHGRIAAIQGTSRSNPDYAIREVSRTDSGHTIQGASSSDSSCEIQEIPGPDLNHMRLLVCCGDHGIVEEGVSQSPQSVTAVCAENIGKGVSTAGILAKAAGAEIHTIDVGINQPGPVPGTEYRRVANGTKNFLREPAMTKQELRQALQVGMNLAEESRMDGITLLGIGEMGIGNTTSAAVLTGKMLGLTAEEVTGRGAGLDSAGMLRKLEVVRQALAESEVVGGTEFIFGRYGGLELAAMSGIIIGSACCGIPVILDGVLSMVSALAAERLAPGCREYLIPSHMSREPAAERLAAALRLEPVIDGAMATGEGAGAALMMSVLRAVDRVYREAERFDGYGIAEYTRYEEVE